MDLNQSVLQLDAVAEPSRLRLLAVLLGGETTVGDLVAVLEQSQPRVSRHLRLLAEAGLVESFREGRSIYYRWSAAGLAAGVAGPVAAVAASDDAVIAGDRVRLKKLSRQRERDSLRRALRAGQARALHAADSAAALAELFGATLADESLGDLLVVGCGSGELFRLLLPKARTAVATEPSGHRRQVARARVRHDGQPHWTIRDAAPAGLPFDDASFDVAILNDVLCTDAELQPILTEVARVLRPTGRLLILDRILPTNSELAAQLAVLGLTVNRRQWLPGRAPDRALFQASWLEATPTRTGTDD